MQRGMFLMQKNLNNAFITLNNYLSIFQIAKHTYDFSNNFRTVLISVHKQFIKKKRANNFLDFSDLNHLAIKALVHKKEGKLDLLKRQITIEIISLKYTLMNIKITIIYKEYIL